MVINRSVSKMKTYFVSWCHSYSGTVHEAFGSARVDTTVDAYKDTDSFIESICKCIANKLLQQENMVVTQIVILNFIEVKHKK